MTCQSNITKLSDSDIYLIKSNTQPHSRFAEILMDDPRLVCSERTSRTTGRLNDQRPTSVPALQGHPTTRNDWYPVVALLISCALLLLAGVAAIAPRGCEVEINALGNIVFDASRFGIDFVASPQHADGRHTEVGDGIEGVLPIDLHVPGCPPHPVTILDGLLRLLGRL